MKDLQAMAETLRRRHFQCTVFASAEEAKQAALALIPQGASVGFGGSVTVQDLHLYEDLQARGQQVYWHWQVEKAEMDTARKHAMDADWYLCSANALTEAGDIVSTDGSGNRVASMFYGPKEVLFIIGKNKLVSDYEAAIDRIRNVASPRNARRLGLKTPCAVTGKCNDCDSPQRMCHITGVLHAPTSGRTMHVFLVDEDLGY